MVVLKTSRVDTSPLYERLEGSSDDFLFGPA